MVLPAVLRDPSRDPTAAVVIALGTWIVILASCRGLTRRACTRRRLPAVVQAVLWLFVIVCVGLGWLGSKPPEGIYVILARVFTIYYFAFFSDHPAAARNFRKDQAGAEFNFGIGAGCEGVSYVYSIRGDAFGTHLRSRVGGNHEDRRHRRDRPDRLKDRRHSRRPATRSSPPRRNTGVNTITGEGLKQAMAATQVVIDLANSPSFEDKAVLEFFETSGRNLLAAEAATGVRHHVALSIVGTDRSDNGYFRAKVAQEKLIKASGIPYTIIRSTRSPWNSSAEIANSSTDANKVRISPGLFQPIAEDDVAANVAEWRSRRHATVSSRSGRPGTAPFNERRCPLPEDGRRPA